MRAPDPLDDGRVIADMGAVRREKKPIEHKGEANGLPWSPRERRQAVLGQHVLHYDPEYGLRCWKEAGQSNG